MGGTPWATPTQLEYLESMLPAHATAQKEKTLKTFWTTLFKGFFVKWPNQVAELAEGFPATPEDKSRKTKSKGRVQKTFEDEKAWIKDRKEKMQTWMNNHRLTCNSRTGGGSKIQISVNPTRKKVSSLVQIYTRMFYESHLKEHVEPCLQGVPEKSVLATKNKIISELWTKESEARKKEVEQEQAKERKALDEERKREESVNDHVRTPEEYLSGISSLRNMAEGFFTKMEQRSGWSFTLIAGGPDPREGGELTSFALHSSRNKFGLSFGKAHPNFEETFLPPFVSFLEQVYSPEVRKQRALKVEESRDAFPAAQSDVVQQPEESCLPPSAKVHLEAPVALGTPLTVSTASTTLQPTPASETACIGNTVPHMFSTPFYTETAIREPMTSNPIMLSTTWQQDMSTTTTSVQGYHNGGLTCDTSQDAGAPFSNTMAAPSNDSQFVSSSSPWGVSSWETLTDGINWTDPNLFTLLPFAGPASNPLGAAYSAHSGVVNASPDNLDTSINLNEAPFINPGYLSNDSALVTHLANTTTATPPETNTLSMKPSDGLIQAVSTNGSVSPGASSIQTPDPPKNARSAATKENVPLALVESTASIASARQRKPVGSKEVIPLVQQKAALPSEWFAKADSHLSTGISSPEWQDCLRHWRQLENQNGLLETLSHRLPACKDRPEVLSTWMASSRDYNAVPNIDDPLDFGNKWVTWWNKMQPPWRRDGEKNAMPKPLTPENNTLSSLKRCGPAGLVTVLIGLKWWGSTGKDAKRWLVAVEDVRACLKLMLDGAGGTKRKSSQAEDSGRGGKKRKG